MQLSQQKHTPVLPVVEHPLISACPLAPLSLLYQVREAQLAQYNYILVVGEAERVEGTVNVRTRDNHIHGMHKLDEVLEVLQQERSSRSLISQFEKQKQQQQQKEQASA